MAPRDEFVRQTGPLAGGVGTRPLGPEARLPLAVLVEKVRDVIARIQAAAKPAEPVIELLFEACNRAVLDVPGVPSVAYRHDRTAKGEEIVLYLVEALDCDVALPRAVPIAVFRFYDCTGAVPPAERAIEAGKVAAPLVEQLRLKLYHLMHYHLQFRDDPVLRQLFPGPKTHAKPAPPPAMTNAQRMKLKVKLERALQTTESQLFALEPLLPKLTQLANQLTKPDFRVAGFLDPESRQARFLAIALGPDEAATTLVKALPGQIKALRAAVDAARKNEDPEGLEALAAPLSTALHELRRHVILRSLLPPAPAS